MQFNFFFLVFKIKDFKEWKNRNKSFYVGVNDHPSVTSIYFITNFGFYQIFYTLDLYLYRFLYIGFTLLYLQLKKVKYSNSYYSIISWCILNVKPVFFFFKLIHGCNVDI